MGTAQLESALVAHGQMLSIPAIILLHGKSLEYLYSQPKCPMFALLILLSAEVQIFES